MTTDSLEPHTTAAEFPAEQNIRRRSPHSPWATSGRTFATGCLESVPFFGPHLSSPSFLPAPARHHSLAQPGTWPASHNGPLQDGIVFGFGGFRESSESCPCSIKRSILGSYPQDNPRVKLTSLTFTADEDSRRRPSMPPRTPTDLASTRKLFSSPRPAPFHVQRMT